MKNNTKQTTTDYTPETKRTLVVCGHIIRVLSIISIIIIGLPCLFIGFLPVFIIVVILSILMWKLGKSWLKQGETKENIKEGILNVSRESYYIKYYLAKNCDPTPINLGIYASKAEGFLNWSIHEVIGIKESTNRENKRYYNAVSENHAKKLAHKEGITVIKSIKILPHEPPTEKQLSYAKDLGLSIPSTATKWDVRDILSRLLDSTDVIKQKAISDNAIRLYKKPLIGPTEELAIFACQKEILFSAFISEIDLLKEIIRNLDTRDILAFYAYCVKCYEREIRIGNLLTDINYEKFYEFADKAITSEAIVRSIEGRYIEDYLNPHKGTIVYKECKKYI